MNKERMLNKIKKPALFFFHSRTYNGEKLVLFSKFLITFLEICIIYNKVVRILLQ